MNMNMCPAICSVVTTWSEPNTDIRIGDTVAKPEYKYLKRKRGKGYQRVVTYSYWKCTRANHD